MQKVILSRDINYNLNIPELVTALLEYIDKNLSPAYKNMSDTIFKPDIPEIYKIKYKRKLAPYSYTYFIRQNDDFILYDKWDGVDAHYCPDIAGKNIIFYNDQYVPKLDNIIKNHLGFKNIIHPNSPFILSNLNGYSLVDANRMIVKHGKRVYHFANSIKYAITSHADDKRPLALNAFRIATFYFKGANTLHLHKRTKNENIRILSYNVHGFAPIFYSYEEDNVLGTSHIKFNWDTIKAIKKNQDIDVIGMQEAGRNPFVNNIPAGKYYHFTNTKKDKQYHITEFKGISVCNIHLPIREHEEEDDNNKQRNDALAEISDDADIIIGDFNMTYDKVTSLGDYTRAEMQTKVYQNSTPFNRVDHCYYKKSRVELVNTKILPFNLSDHYPLFASFRIL